MKIRIYSKELENKTTKAKFYVYNAVVTGNDSGKRIQVRFGKDIRYKAPLKKGYFTLEFNILLSQLFKGTESQPNVLWINDTEARVIEDLPYTEECIKKHNKEREEILTDFNIEDLPF